MSESLSPNDWLILRMLEKSPQGLHLFSLYKYTGFDASTLARAIGGLMKVGLAEKLGAEESVEAVRISSAGRLLLSKYPAPPQRHIASESENRGRTGTPDVTVPSLPINAPYLPRLSELSKRFGRARRKKK